MMLQFPRNTRPHSLPAIIYRSELDFLSRCILDFPDIETGGQLFGFWTDQGVPVVLYVIGPGPAANHQTAFFNQDLHYLQTVGDFLYSRFGLQHIGEWHSHHRLGLARPSGHDANTMFTSIAKVGLNSFLLCIGNCSGSASEINAFLFQNGRSDYQTAPWIVKELESPFRPLVDRQLANIIVEPQTPYPHHSGHSSVSGESRTVPPAYSGDYWLSDKNNSLQLKEIVDYLGALSGDNPAVRLDDDGHVHIFCNYRSYSLEAFFPQHFPDEPPVLRFSPATNGTASAAVWPRSGEIARRFKTFFRATAPLTLSLHDVKRHLLS